VPTVRADAIPAPLVLCWDDHDEPDDRASARVAPRPSLERSNSARRHDHLSVFRDHLSFANLGERRFVGNTWRRAESAWNVQAGSALPEQIGDYSGFLPFLEGWDFRINLPHVRFHQAGSGAGSLAAMVGVVEDGTPVTSKSGTLRRYGHRNNAIWIFRVARAHGELAGRYRRSLARNPVPGAVVDSSHRPWDQEARPSERKPAA
jgi:hypothetical protein